MYVAITKQLVADTSDLIRSMAKREASLLPQPALGQLDEFRQYVLNHLWGQHMHLMADMPKDWMGEAASMVLEVRYRDETGCSWVNNEHPTFTVPIKIPPKISSYSVRATIQREETSGELRAELDKGIAIHEHYRRWDKNRVKVIEFIENCKSLNEALKLWPAVALYIPKQYLSKAEEKRGRGESEKRESGAADILKSINTDELTAAAVGARLA
jgi:hypothetical protein